VIWLFSALAFLAIGAVWGTDTLGRPLTDEEKKRFGALLREHDYPGKRLVALRFANRLTGSRQRALDLMGRVDLRLVRQGWDPSDVSLLRRLCRLVWSEWTHATSETATARKAEEHFLAGEGVATASVQDKAVAEETRRASQAHAQAQLDKLRAGFEKAGDEVNLGWLDATLDGVTDLQEIAKRLGRDVTEMYRAADRRKRLVRRLLAEENGAPYNEEES